MIFFKIFTLIAIQFVSLQVLSQDEIKPAKGNWTKGSTEKFKGNVWVEYFIKDSLNDFLSSRVLFEPHARSNWHKHTGKQIILAIEGEGYYKELGKQITLLKKGDVVIIQPGTIHSHGSVGKKFTQSVTMNDIYNVNTTTWLGVINEEDLK